MTILSNSGKKAVKISNSNGSFIAMYIQFDNLNQNELILESKTYSTLKRAQKWAAKVL